MPDYASLRLTRDGGLATVALDHGKVNAIDTQLSRDLEAVYRELSEDDSVEGVVLSGKPHCFCAGLNVVHLATSDPAGLRAFFVAYLRALQTMVRFPKPCVAAMTGFAPAGGTTLALTADYRVMGQGAKHTVGLNEFNMSLQIPRMMGDIFAHYLGEPLAWSSVQHARMYDSEAALRLGLVDESVAVDEVLPRATAHCRRLMQVHPPVFQRTKRYFRRGLLAAVDVDVEAAVDVVEEDFTDPKFRAMMELFVASLKK